MRSNQISLKWSDSIYNNLDVEFYPDQFYDISGDIALRHGILMFGKEAIMKASQYQNKVKTFKRDVKLQSQLFQIAMAMSIDGGEIVYFEPDENGNPALKFTKFYDNSDPTTLIVFEKIPYEDQSSKGWVTIKKEITATTISVYFYQSRGDLGDMALNDFYEFGQAIDLKTFNELSKLVKYREQTYRNPYGLWYKVVMNMPSESFDNASDSWKIQAINIAAQRALYFAVADNEKSQATVYKYGDGVEEINIDPIGFRVTTSKNSVLNDKIELINSDDENGKMEVVPATPKAKDYLEQFEKYVELAWNKSGYSYKANNSDSLQTATGVVYFSRGDKMTADVKKQFYEEQFNEVVAKWFTLYLGQVKAKPIEIEFEIQPNYEISENDVFDLLKKKFDAGVITLEEFVQKTNQISEEEAKKRLEGKNIDFINAKLKQAETMNKMGIFDEETIAKFLFGNNKNYKIKEPELELSDEEYNFGEGTGSGQDKKPIPEKPTDFTPENMKKYN